MNETIKVHVVKYPDRANYMMRYRDPDTGKHVARSTGTTIERDSLKAAAIWEEQLQTGRYQRTSRMPWEEFRDHYERITSDGQKLATVRNYASTLNAFEEHCRPQRVADLNTARVTTFALELRKRKLSEASVARHLRHLKAVARWANRQGLLPTVPQFDMPKRATAAKMKGRPIVAEEFDRLLRAVPRGLQLRVRTDVDTAAVVESWRLLLRGLWATGLRLGEAMALRWDHQPGGVSVDLDGEGSVLMFDADSQKSGRVQMVPLAPEAVELLTPLKRSRGYVFTPLTKLGKPMARDHQKAGKLIAKIGEAAGIITDAAAGRTATAHDLRRAFGARWAKRVMPATLKEIMRHADVSTTLTYYTGQTARATAAELWAVASQCDQKGQHHQTLPQEECARSPR